MSTIKTKFTLNTHHKNFIPQTPQIELSSLSDVDNIGTFCLGIVVLILIALCLMILIIIAALGIGREVLFTYDSQITTAQVTDCAMQKSRVLAYPLVHYTYQLDGHMYKGDVNDSVFFSCENYSSGTQLQVRYLRSDPSFSRKVEDKPDNFISIAACVGAVIMASIIVWTSKALHRYLEAKSMAIHLQRNGILLEGEIVSIQGVTRSKGFYFVVVHYQFESPHKTLLQGHNEAYRGDLKGRPLPPIGTPVAILYADDHAHMML